VLVIDGKNNSDDGSIAKAQERQRSEMRRRDPKVTELAGGSSKVEPLKRWNLPSGRNCKLRRRRDSGRQIEHYEESGPLDQSPIGGMSTQRRGEQISAVRSECMDQQPLDPKESARDKF
jgi:hypothetical protein